MSLFRRRKEERERWGDPPWLRKTKRMLLTVGALLITVSLFLFVRGQAVSLGLVLLIIGFFSVALTVKD